MNPCQPGFENELIFFKKNLTKIPNEVITSSDDQNRGLQASLALFFCKKKPRSGVTWPESLVHWSELPRLGHKVRSSEC